MKQLTIQEWFARSVAAGLMPEWPDIYAEMHTVTVDGLEQQQYCCVSKVKEDDNFCLPYNYIESFDGTIQLRQNNKDLYLLEWRKPTEQNVGKMCWFANENSHRRIEIDAFGYLNKMCNEYNNQLCYFAYGSGYIHYYCLLADHGRLAPTEADFKRIYGE